MKRTLFAIRIVAVLVLILVFSNRGRKAPGTPKTIDSPTIEGMLNVHGSNRRDLKICNRTFRDIWKGGLGYAIVPKSALILFVYPQSSDDKALVVVDTNTCCVLEIPLRNVRFRGNFHSKQNPEQRKIADYVE